MSSFASSSQNRAVSAWLVVVILLVVAIILVGGATRLTNSGLSITEWRPISGALPPLSDAAWALEFEKYQQIPEFAEENPDMGLSGFKFIYFMEWSHRQLGRLVGLAYVLPLLIFMGLGRIRQKRGQFIGIALLIGLQGAIGWWMVSSGLTERVSVSQYRLATHLGMAFIILAALFWLWRDYKQNWPGKLKKSPLEKPAMLLFLLVFLQIIAGAFVAGTHAGRSYNTWPLMDGGLIPGGYLAMNPWWINMFENVASIQFNHRMLGYILFFVAIWVWRIAKRRHEQAVRRAAAWLLMAIFFQIILGIIALLKFIALPYALLHQAGAIVVFLFAVWILRTARIKTY